jgi:hypothetical protein
MRAGALRDIAPLFREERRSRPSKTGNFAGFLIDIFHINRRAAAIDAPETLPDIGGVDDPANHQEVVDGRSQSGVRPGRHGRSV